MRRPVSILLAMALLLSGTVMNVRALETGRLSIPAGDDDPARQTDHEMFAAMLSGYGADASESALRAKASRARFGLREWHRYLGYATLVLAGATAVSSSNKSVHYGCAYSATGAAVATCLTGYFKYGKRFRPGRGLLKDDNLHIILGVVGTIGMVAAVALADSEEEGSHAGIGNAGAASMVVSVIVIEW